MSFHFNLSSDEEDLDEWTRREGLLNTTSPANDDAVKDRKGSSSSFEFATSGATANAKPLDNDFDKELEKDSGDDDDDDDDLDEDSIAWEDVDVEEEKDDDRKPAAVDTTNNGDIPIGTKTSLRPVTVNLDQKGGGEEPPKKKRKIKARKKFRIDSMPDNLQSLLKNLHRTHLLVLTSLAYRISEQASNPDLLALGLSLLPDNLDCTNDRSRVEDEFVIPSLAEFKKLCKWYLDLIQGARLRRQARFRENRAAGAPVYRGRGGRRQGGGQRRQPQKRSQSGAVQEAEHDEVDDFPTIHSSSLGASVPRIAEYAVYLSNSVSHDPRFGEESAETQSTRWNSHDQNQLMLSVLRSLGWRARFVMALDPMSCDLDVNHPLLAMSRNIFQSMAKKKNTNASQTGTPNLESEKESSKPAAVGASHLGWIEVLCRDARQPNKLRWIHLDPANRLVNQPDQVEVLLKDITSHTFWKRRAILAYSIAVEHTIRGAKFTDVTPRYAHSFVASLRRRGLLRGRGAKKALTAGQLRQTWWGETIHKLNQELFRDFEQHTILKLKSQGNSPKDAIAIEESDSDDEKKGDDTNKHASQDLFAKVDDAEKEELHASALNEAIPTSKSAFQTHPIFVIKSVLGNAEVLAPDASKRICGMFKGEMVFRRSDVSTAHSARKWPYLGRKVRQAELCKPIKQVKARKKAASKNFKALKSYGVGMSNDGSEERRSQDIHAAMQPLEDGMERLYAKWQTDPWSPAFVAPTDEIPVNEYNNVELELLNPGLVHIDQRGLSKVAKKLGIPYAPCMLGFEGNGGNRTPTVRGIVVHAHNEQLLREAGEEVTSHTLEQESNNRRKLVFRRWKKLLSGLLIKDDLERKFGE